MAMSAETIGLVAAGIGSVFWMLTYTLAIWLGFKQKTYAIPAAAIIGNVAWEFVFAFVFPQSSPAQAVINTLWFGLDVIIVVTYLKYGRKEFPADLSPHLFIPTFILGIMTALALYWSAATQLQDFSGNISAFSLNLMISILFIEMLLRRKSVEGQSMYVALFKMFGSVGYGVLFTIRHPSWAFIITLSLSTFVFDLIYTVLLYRKFKIQGLSPFHFL
jgi:hypothetical protein